MLAYALKLTRTPAEMTADDVEALRAAGFDFVNRIADGLGVELEGRFTR